MYNVVQFNRFVLFVCIRDGCVFIRSHSTCPWPDVVTSSYCWFSWSLAEHLLWNCSFLLEFSFFDKLLMYICITWVNHHMHRQIKKNPKLYAANVSSFLQFPLIERLFLNISIIRFFATSVNACPLAILLIEYSPLLTTCLMKQVVYHVTYYYNFV